MTNQIETILVRRKAYLEDVIRTKSKLLKGKLEGRLRTCRIKGNYYYYLVKEKGDTTGKYISKKDMHLAERIAQREYNERMLHAAEKELSILNRLLKYYKSDVLEYVYPNLSEGKRRIVKSDYLTDEEYACLWESQSYVPKEIDDNVPELYTEKNERVRSKSEIIIANTLLSMNIPYKYEMPLKLKAIWTRIHPDFTVLNKRTRKVYYWEHFGMMDDLDYVKKNMKKLDVYIKNGIYVGDQLILTTETSTEPLQTSVIKQMINKYLI